MKDEPEDELDEEMVPLRDRLDFQLGVLGGRPKWRWVTSPEGEREGDSDVDPR